jgi:hypothetical protein
VLQCPCLEAETAGELPAPALKDNHPLLASTHPVTNFPFVLLRDSTAADTGSDGRPLLLSAHGDRLNDRARSQPNDILAASAAARPSHELDEAARTDPHQHRGMCDKGITKSVRLLWLRTCG